MNLIHPSWIWEDSDVGSAETELPDLPVDSWDPRIEDNEPEGSLSRIEGEPESV